MNLGLFKIWLAKYGSVAAIGAGAVDTAELAADAVDGTKIEDDAVDSEHITDGAIDPAHLATNSVTTVKIADGAVTGDKIAAGTILATDVADGAITNAKINAGANIDLSKIAIASGKVMIGDGSTIGVAYTISGDITISSTGVAAIVAGTIINADINASAAILFSKLENLDSGKILVGSAGNVPTEVVMSGDVAIIADGTTTIQEGAVDVAMIEGLASTEFIIGVDGTAANNAKVTMSSDVTMDNAGATTIAALAIDNGKVATAAAIVVTKLEGLAAGALLIGVDGTGANNLKAVLSGDVTMDATGDVTIAAAAVEETMLARTKYPTRLSLVDCHPVAAVKDALPDAPDSTSLGLADAAGSLLLGTSTNNTAESESIAFDLIIPDSYVDGALLDVRIRGKVSVNRDTAQTFDLTAKIMGDTLGGDIVTTTIETVTNAFADYDFAINPAGVVAGDKLHCVLTVAMNDGGGGSGAGVPSVSRIALMSTNRA